MGCADDQGAPDNWVTVPTNSILTIHKQTVMIHPIIDEYYNHSPSYTRRSEFAKSKGLVSSAPGVMEVLTPAVMDLDVGGVGVVEKEEEMDVVRQRLEVVQRERQGGV